MTGPLYEHWNQCIVLHKCEFCCHCRKWRLNNQWISYFVFTLFTDACVTSGGVYDRFLVHTFPKVISYLYLNQFIHIPYSQIIDKCFKEIINNAEWTVGGYWKVHFSVDETWELELTCLHLNFPFLSFRYCVSWFLWPWFLELLIWTILLCILYCSLLSL